MQVAAVGEPVSTDHKDIIAKGVNVANASSLVLTKRVEFWRIVYIRNCIQLVEKVWISL